MAFQHIICQGKKNRDQKGFSLLEALTALAVLSIIMSTLMDAYSIGLRGADSSEKKTEATMLVHSLLSEALAVRQTRVGRRSGRIKRYVWQIDTTLIERISIKKNKGKEAWGLFEIKITIKAGSVVLTKLETFKVDKIRV